MIKNTINIDQRGRVLSWKKHEKDDVRQELEAAIRGDRSLPNKPVGPVHNFQDVLTSELNEYVPGGAYFRRRGETNVRKTKIASGKSILKFNTGSMTYMTDD